MITRLFPTHLAFHCYVPARLRRTRVDNRRVTGRVLIVEDDGFTRMLLRSQIETLGYTVVADAPSVTTALTALASLTPDVALLDLDLGRGPTGIDLAIALRERIARIGIVLLTSYADTRLIGDRRPLPTGSLALVKRSLQDSSQLDDALRMALASPLGLGRAPDRSALKLSDGQVEILRLVANGFSNAEIAKRRTLSESAVIKAVGRLVDQLELHPQPGDNQRVLLTQAYFQLTGTSGERRG